MNIKETFDKERKELTGVKRPYETAAFLLFAILLFQQIFFLFRNFVRFAFDSTVTFMSTANITVGANLMTFVSRIINVDSDNWLYVLLGIGCWLLYYFLIWLFVWNYCQKRGLAKWTWTVFVAFGPTIFLAPPFMWFAIYVFRPYIMRFIKKAVVEFKEFDPNQEFEEELPEPEVKEEPKVEEKPKVEKEPEKKEETELYE